MFQTNCEAVRSPTGTRCTSSFSVLAHGQLHEDKLSLLLCLYAAPVCRIELSPVRIRELPARKRDDYKFLSTLDVQPMRAISNECLPSCTRLIRNLSVACQMVRSVRATVHLLSWLQVSPCGTLVTALAQSRHCC